MSSFLAVTIAGQNIPWPVFVVVALIVLAVVFRPKGNKKQGKLAYQMNDGRQQQLKELQELMSDGKIDYREYQAKINELYQK